MSESTIENKKIIQKILSEILTVAPESIDTSRMFTDYPNIDSIVMLNLMIATEGEFNVQFDMSEIEKYFGNIDDLAEHLSTKK